MSKKKSSDSKEIRKLKKKFVAECNSSSDDDSEKSDGEISSSASDSDSDWDQGGQTPPKRINLIDKIISQPFLTPDSRMKGRFSFRKYSTNPKSLVYIIENLMLVSNQPCGITGVQWLSSYSWYYHSPDLFSSRLSVVLNNEYLLPRRFNNDNLYTYN